MSLTKPSPNMGIILKLQEELLAEPPLKQSHTLPEDERKKSCTQSYLPSLLSQEFHELRHRGHLSLLLTNYCTEADTSNELQTSQWNKR